MSQSKESKDIDPPFRWGIKRGLGVCDKSVQFYESFVYDGIEYTLYDCVYLFKKEEVKPYIGKILGIWEHSDHKKRVKILWFFEPNDILDHLGNHDPLEKEIFLACGEGVGLVNVNPLEAIAGKCHVICTSKDARNRLPSKEEVARADYIFYRTFDVGKLTISDKLGDKIAGVEVKFLLNWREDARPNLLKSNSLKGLGRDEGVDKPGLTASKDAANEAKALSKIKAAQRSGYASIRDSSKAAKFTDCSSQKKPGSARDRAYPVMPDVRPLKRLKETDEPDARKSRNEPGVRKSIFESYENNDLRLHKGSSEKIKLNERKHLPPDEFVKRASLSMVGNSPEIGPKILEVTSKPVAERSKWFKAIPWEEKMQKASQQGTIVLLDNLDPGYTSADVENIVYTFSSQSCSAKVIHQATYEDPNYGRAYAIFKNRDAADAAVQLLNKRCLVQQSGRPLVCTKGILRLPKPQPKFTGHLAIPKMRRQMQQQDMRKAVSTSHCSQPNTIEYELAIDWILLQERSASWFDRLHKRHREDIKQERCSKTK